MSIEQRRSPRIIDFLPLEVFAIHSGSKHSLAGPFSGRIIDLSSHGACLLMTQIFLKDFHVFHSTLQEKSAQLRLQIFLDSESGTVNLQAQPIWLGPFRQQEISAHKMGIEFIENPEEGQIKKLLALLQENQAQRGQWWKEHCHCFTKNSDTGQHNNA